MADVINAKGSDSKFRPHPEGQFVAQCVDAIDLGEKVETFPNTPEKLVHKCAVVFRTGERNPETNDLIDIAQEFTVSMSEKANLRKALESWRGKPYTEDQITEGVPLHKLEGSYALIAVAHKKSGQGRTYAFVQSIVGVPKAMQSSLSTFPAYARPEYWQTRKDEYLKGASALRTKYKAPGSSNGGDDFEEFPGALQDEDDDLPF